MHQKVLDSVEEVILAANALKEPKALEFIEKSKDEIVACFKKGGKLLIAGNGGSLCDSIHFAEEFTGQFRKARVPLPAIALADPGHLTCVANDFGYESVFARSVDALGKPEDLFIVLSTSGNSVNLINAAHIAKRKGLKTIAFLGKTGGKMKGFCDLEWIVTGFPFADRIQEAHMAAIHVIIEHVEYDLFYAKSYPFVGALSH